MSAAAGAAALRDSRLEIVGKFVDASNVTLLAQTPDGSRCVYKPTSGERPLWDFPAGTLSGREVAMYQLAAALGWDVVPATVLRPDGPLGAGVCQRYVEASDPPRVLLAASAEIPAGWLVVAGGRDEDGSEAVLAHADDPDLQRIALLDVVANNADRKGGHLLTDAEGRTWGIDHGLTFNTDDKLRTVLWGFSGTPIPVPLLADLCSLLDTWSSATAELVPLVSEVEMAAARERLAALVASERFPQPAPGWPRLPWPPM